MYIFTGEGKGKTSAAIGVAVRAMGVGMKVGWVAFYKQESWKLSEVSVLRKLGIQVYLLGLGFNLGGPKVAPIAGDQVVVDSASETEHKLAAAKALNKARELLEKVDLLVLDEVNNAVDDGLISVAALESLIANRKQRHLVLTGRNAQAKVIEAADLVTQMKKVKHPYDSGKLAVYGLDY